MTTFLCLELLIACSSVGLEARLFSEALDFLWYAERRSVAVAVIDIWMPGVSGLEVKKNLEAVSPIDSRHYNYGKPRRFRAKRSDTRRGHRLFRQAI
jgi:hypothetical protein